MGEVTQEVEAAVNSTAANGAVTTITPTLNYAYDLSGRMVGSETADGSWTTRLLAANTGYDGGTAIALETFYADGSNTRQAVDVYGDVRILTNQLGAQETRTYDGDNRLASDTEPGDANQAALTTHYAYDGLGQRIEQWNSEFGAGVVQTTDYDMDGRVIKTVDYAGHATSYTYTANASISTTGLGTFGGWLETETNAAGQTETTDQDAYGRTVGMTDYGGDTYSYTYDAGGRLITQATTAPGAASAEQTLNNSWYNTGEESQVQASFESSPPATSASTTTQTFTYDAAGDRLTEYYAGTYHLPYNTLYGGVNPTVTTVYENASASYDALGRMVSYSDTPGGSISSASVSYAYDPDGNVRELNATYTPIGAAASSTQTDWYTYDALDRVLVSDGQLSAGVIGANTSQGVQYTYTLAGQRATETLLQSKTATIISTAQSLGTSATTAPPRSTSPPGSPTQARAPARSPTPALARRSPRSIPCRAPPPRPGPTPPTTCRAATPSPRSPRRSGATPPSGT
jgi:YD repeat-containing protein